MKIVAKRLVCILLMAVLVLPSFAATEPLSPQQVSVVFTHDMHSHLAGENDTGGFARVKTVIDQARADDPNTLVLDAGDFSMGTPYQTIFSTVAPEYTLLKAMGYTAVTLGNHEFDYRTKGLVDMLTTATTYNTANVPLIVSNIEWIETSRMWDFEGDGIDLQQLFTKVGSEVMWANAGGARVLIFGLMGIEADSFAPESGVVFCDPIETAKKIVERYGDDADMIICLSHSGTDSNTKESEDHLLATAVPEIDFIVSGHTHTTLEKPIVVGNTTIGSVGAYTNNVGRATFTRNDDGRWSTDDYRLVRLDESVAEDPDILREVELYRGIVSGMYFTEFGYHSDQVLASNDIEFTSSASFGDTPGGDTLGDLISDSYIYAVAQAEAHLGDAGDPVDVAIVPAGVVRASFGVGDITVTDAYKVSSLGIGPDGVPGYPLVGVYLTGAELKTAAEVDASVSNVMSQARLYMSGLQYSFNTNRLFMNRVTDVKLSVLSDVEGGGITVTSDLDDDQLYRVVGDLYSCQMLNTVKDKSLGLMSIVPKDADGNPIENFEDHIVYDADGKELKAWYALASYIDSFEGDRVPDYYGREPNDRKIVTSSWNPIELVRSPNKVFFMLLAALLLIIAVVVVVVRLIRRRRKAKASS